MWMDLQCFMLKEISQKERKTLPFTYMWNPKKKKKKNKHNKIETETWILRKQKQKQKQLVVARVEK